MGSPVAGLEGTSEGEALDNGIVLEKFLVCTMEICPTEIVYPNHCKPLCSYCCYEIIG